MITQEQFTNWISTEGIQSEPIENGIKFAGDNPWDSVENGTYYGTIQLINATLHVNFVEDGWNGYGEEEFTDLDEFRNRWSDVMENGLTG